ncbi:hypothetical protein [Sansalvadorimonas verongulae]|uniref:hypothetical protein n=1 Tax=Sansalvadorimonas verongulae TaxID=2172824 RepID=UPI0012BB6429|nr:hypothetical protein [Sansalvadorimonas verongulae]MTI13355.1 hypothetical protein [Sansalvadorimonas verongulae]
MKLVKEISTKIQVLQIDDSRFTVRTVVDNKTDAQYGTGTQQWAEGLAHCIANGDNPREYCRQPRQC